MTVSIYDAEGRVVRRLFEGSGPTELRWDGRGDDGKLVASGAYHAILRATPGTSREAILVER